MIDISFREEPLTIENGMSFFEDIFTSSDEGVTVVDCSYINNEDSLADSFWKEFVCGPQSESPYCFVVVKTTPSFRDGYRLVGGCTFEFQVVLDVLKKVLGLKEDVGVLRDVDYMGTMQYGRVCFEYKDTERCPISAITVSSTDDPLASMQTTLIAIPRTVTVPSDWNKMTASMKKNYIRYRLKKVFA